MYASLGIWVAAPGNNDNMCKLADAAPAQYKGVKGFKRAVYFSDPSRNEYGAITVWDSKEDYEAFVKASAAARAKIPREWFAGTLFESRGFYVNNSF